MKYLNTNYMSLLDSTSNVTYESNVGTIYSKNAAGNCNVVKNIYAYAQITSLYFKCTLYGYGDNLSNNYYMNIRTIKDGTAGENVILYSTSTQIKLAGATNTYPATTFNVPSSVGYITAMTSNALYKRDIMLHIDTVQNVIELYSDGILYGTITTAWNGQYFNSITIGNLNGGTFNQYFFAVKDIIISDSVVYPTEGVVVATPELSSTDWTILSNGQAETNILNGTMTLTAPVDALDETKKTIIGYSTAFTKNTPSNTINAVNVTQDNSTQQVLIPYDISKETDVFPVSRLSDISATITSAYVSS